MTLKDNNTKLLIILLPPAAKRAGLINCSGSKRSFTQLDSADCKQRIGRCEAPKSLSESYRSLPTAQPAPAAVSDILDTPDFFFWIIEVSSHGRC